MVYKLVLTDFVTGILLIVSRLCSTVSHTRSRQLLLTIDGYTLCVPRMGTLIRKRSYELIWERKNLPNSGGCKSLIGELPKPISKPQGRIP